MYLAVIPLEVGVILDWSCVFFSFSFPDLGF